MTPPRRRRNQPATNVQSIRSSIPLTPRSNLESNGTAPLTRSRTRILSTLSTRKSNENVKITPSAAVFNKSLRSRGPLKENIKMSVYNDNIHEQQNGTGKRKAEDIDGDVRKGKLMKMDEKAVRKMGPPLRPVASNHSIKARQTMAPALSPNRTSVRTQASAPPTPAREILRQGILQNKTSQESLGEDDSHRGEFVVRPPTPPRAHQTDAPVKDGNGNTYDSPPRFVIRPPTPPRIHQQEVAFNHSASSATSPRRPKVQAHPGPVRNPPQKSVEASPVTYAACMPATPPSKASGVTSTTPSSRPKMTSPLSNRMIALAAKKVWEGASLDSLVMQSSPAKKPVDTVLKVVEMEPAESMDIDTRSETLSIMSTAELASSVPMDTVTKMAVDENTAAAPPPAPELGSASGLTSAGVMNTAPNPQLHKQSSSRSMNASRIPVSTRPMPAASLSMTDKSNIPSSSIKKQATGLGVGTVSERRFVGRPAMVGGQPLSPSHGPSSSPTKRRPSYPSSLGSGPLARPTSRVVSNPMLPPPIPEVSDPSPSSSFLTAPTCSQRSVSAPTARPRMSLNTREGMSAETSQSLQGLSQALERLKARKRLSMSMSASTPSISEPARKMSISTIAIPTPAPRDLEDCPSNLFASTSSATSSKPRPRTSSPGDTSIEGGGAGDMSLSDMLNAKGVRVFSGVVAFVDVRTSDGTDGASVFIDILKGAGAKVLTRPSPSCTHIVYKSGRISTQNWYRRQEDYKPRLVGIRWVTDSRKAGKKLDEEKYLVDLSDEAIFNLVQRRKSIEPKSLAEQGGVMMSTKKKASLLAVAEARRKSMVYAPKLPSPLKKAFISLPPSEDKKR